MGQYNSLGDEEFSREIEFKVYDRVYRIVWYANESTLYIGKDKRSPFIKFKYLTINDTMPIVGGNKNLQFSYEKFEKKSIFDKEYPYHTFRIPLAL